MTSEAAFISCPLSSHLAIQYLYLSVNLFTTHDHIFVFVFFTSWPFALWFHIWEAEPYNGSALLFASVSLCSIWSCERAGEGGCWIIWTLACCSVFVQAALCFALRLRDTQKEKSPPSRAVEHKWMSTTEDIFHMGRCISADYQSHSAYIPSLSSLLSREELESIFA